MNETEEMKRNEELFREAVKIAEEGRGVSTSLLQRRLSIGYGRAAKLLDRLEEEGYDISKRVEGSTLPEGMELAPGLEESPKEHKEMRPIDVFRGARLVARDNDVPRAIRLLQRYTSLSYEESMEFIRPFIRDNNDAKVENAEGDAEDGVEEVVTEEGQEDLDKGSEETADPMNQYNEVRNNLYKLCLFFKERIFEGDLPPFVLTLTPSSKRSITYGWCRDRAWLTEKTDKAFCEINICSQYLSRTFEDVAETVLHELVHLYAAHKDIKDTSSNGKYHNKRYKELGERFGLVVKNTGSYLGWTETTLSESTKKLLEEFEDRNFKLVSDNTYARTGTAGSGSTPKRKIRHYVCPCGQKIRSTKDLDIVCGKCGGKFEN